MLLATALEHRLELGTFGKLVSASHIGERLLKRIVGSELDGLLAIDTVNRLLVALLAERPPPLVQVGTRLDVFAHAVLVQLVQFKTGIDRVELPHVCLFFFALPGAFL